MVAICPGVKVTLTCHPCVIVRLLAVRAVVTVAPLFKQCPERSGIESIGGEVAWAWKTKERITKDTMIVEAERTTLDLANGLLRKTRLQPESFALV